MPERSLSLGCVASQDLACSSAHSNATGTVDSVVVMMTVLSVSSASLGAGSLSKASFSSASAALGSVSNCIVGSESAAISTKSLRFIVTSSFN